MKREATPWHVHSWTMTHPEHGTFFVGFSHVSGKYNASRVHGEQHDLQFEWVGGEGNTHLTLGVAKRAIAKRIKQLDAELAAPAAERVLYSCEQLEANREFEVLR